MPVLVQLVLVLALVVVPLVMLVAPSRRTTPVPPRGSDGVPSRRVQRQHVVLFED